MVSAAHRYSQVVRVEGKRVLLYVIENGQLLLMLPRQHEHLLPAFNEIIDHIQQLQCKKKDNV